MGTYFKSEIKIKRKEDQEKEFNEKEINEIINKLSKKIIDKLDEPVLYELNEMKEYLKNSMTQELMDYYDYSYLIFNIELKYFSIEDMNIKINKYIINTISKR